MPVKKTPLNSFNPCKPSKPQHPSIMKDTILHETTSGIWVSNEGTRNAPKFHVWEPNGTHCTCDSAYADISLAVARANYMEGRLAQ